MARTAEIVILALMVFSVVGCGGAEEPCPEGEPSCTTSDTLADRSPQPAGDGETLRDGPDVRFGGQNPTMRNPDDTDGGSVEPTPEDAVSALPPGGDADDGPEPVEDALFVDATSSPGDGDGQGGGGPEDSGASSSDADSLPVVQDSGSVSPDDVGPEGPPAPLAYPAKTGYQIKGLQPDFWPDIDEIAQNGTGSVAMNLVWSHWEPSLSSPPCDGGKVEYDGHCFKISWNVDDAIRDYSERGVHVTGIVYGVPSWARQGVNCSPVAPGFDIFCKADNPEDYGRFAGMLARRYNGLEGNGRVIDFVIHNEVNANDWFDIGCGQGTPCDADAWVQSYAENYNAAFDRIVSEQPHAKVLMSFDHHFGEAFQIPASQNPKLSVKWFLQQIAPKLGERDWRVAYHPYPPNLLNPQFSPFDYPKVTYGNLGILLGFLHAEFPNDPHAWDVQLTESGVNSVAPHSSPEAQAIGVCDSLYNTLATPGISNYIYHRMKDHPAETVNGLGCGLADEVGNLKPAWSVWATSNRVDLDPPQLSCGFENLPYTRLVRAFNPGQGHWATTRRLPSGFVEEQVYALYREEQPGTTLLFECRTGAGVNFASTSSNCEGQEPMGPMGWIHTESVDGSVALYRCNSGSGDSMISPDPNCEIYQTEELLGYALPWP